MRGERPPTIKDRLEKIISTIDIQEDLPTGLPFREIIVQGNRYLPGIDEDSHWRFLKEPLLHKPCKFSTPFSS